MLGVGQRLGQRCVGGADPTGPGWADELVAGDADAWLGLLGRRQARARVEAEPERARRECCAHVAGPISRHGAGQPRPAPQRSARIGDPDPDRLEPGASEHGEQLVGVPARRNAVRVRGQELAIGGRDQRRRGLLEQFAQPRQGRAGILELLEQCSRRPRASSRRFPEPGRAAPRSGPRPASRPRARSRAATRARTRDRAPGPELGRRARRAARGLGIRARRPARRRAGGRDRRSAGRDRTRARPLSPSCDWRSRDRRRRSSARARSRSGTCSAGRGRAAASAPARRGPGAVPATRGRSRRA